jgi:hypothetical protein
MGLFMFNPKNKLAIEKKNDEYDTVAAAFILKQILIVTKKG